MIYAIFMIVWAIVFLVVLAQARSKDDASDIALEFASPFYRGIYRISFSIPFKWFVEDDNKLTKKGKKLKEQLVQAGYTKKYTVRSFMAFKAIVLLASLGLLGLTLLLLHHVTTILEIFNIDTTHMNGTGLTIDLILIASASYLTIALFPGMILKNKAKKEIVNSNKDLPLLYMFTILMLRSNKTISEILFSLSKLNTYHKEVFERGYRIYLRNKYEGMAYLRSQFDNARFIEMFTLLEDIAEYAREECLSILDSNMKALVDETNELKRRNDLSRLVYSQASMVVPFLSIILLGATPLVVAGLRIFSLSVVI